MNAIDLDNESKSEIKRLRNNRIVVISILAVLVVSALVMGFIQAHHWNRLNHFSLDSFENDPILQTAICIDVLKKWDKDVTNKDVYRVDSGFSFSFETKRLLSVVDLQTSNPRTVLERYLPIIFFSGSKSSYRNAPETLKSDITNFLALELYAMRTGKISKVDLDKCSTIMSPQQLASYRAEIAKVLDNMPDTGIDQYRNTESFFELR